MMFVVKSLYEACADYLSLSLLNEIVVTRPWFSDCEAASTLVSERI